NIHAYKYVFTIFTTVTHHSEIFHLCLYGSGFPSFKNNHPINRPSCICVILYVEQKTNVQHQNHAQNQHYKHLKAHSVTRITTPSSTQYHFLHFVQPISIASIHISYHVQQLHHQFVLKLCRSHVCHYQLQLGVLFLGEILIKMTDRQTWLKLDSILVGTGTVYSLDVCQVSNFSVVFRSANCYFIPVAESYQTR
ncbi:AAEL007108-PA, partial [Aedes aegypti]